MNKKIAAEEQFMFGSNTFKTCALPNVKSLGISDEFPVQDTSRNNTTVESNNFEDSWPASDGSVK